MNDAWLLGLAALIFVVRLGALRRLWRLPLKYGADRFLGAPVAPGFYRGEGAALLRRYRGWLLVPPAADLAAALWLAATGRALALIYEQFVAMVLTSIAYNSIAAHFATRALGAPPAEHAPTAVHLSMAPRRLRDYTNAPLEVMMGAAVVAALVLLARARTPNADGPPLPWVVWLLYLQAGLLLLKRVFVRWRMRLPATRPEEFGRWRSAWLRYHLRVFDAMRAVFALALLFAALWTVGAPASAAVGFAVTAVVWTGALVALTVYCTRERRRLAAVEREVQPVRFVGDFPPPPVATGRFVAGGLLYLGRDEPGVLVRGASGLALNLANVSTYVWAGYLLGLVLLAAWQGTSR